MQQSITAMIRILQEAYPQSVLSLGKRNSIWPYYSIACPLPPRNFTLQFVRNDYLLLEEWKIKLFTKMQVDRRKNMFFAFDNLLINASVIVANRGAHFQSDSEVLQALDVLYTHLVTYYPEAQLFYQHTPLPISYDVFQGIPSVDPLPVLRDHKNGTYHWEEIPHQNIVVANFLHTKFPQVINFSPAHMFRFRPDCREDPVHSCNPGWINWGVVQMLESIAQFNQKLVNI